MLTFHDYVYPQTQGVDPDFIKDYFFDPVIVQNWQTLLAVQTTQSVNKHNSQGAMRTFPTPLPALTPLHVYIQREAKSISEAECYLN